MHHQLIAIFCLALACGPLHAQRLIEAHSPGADAWNFSAAPPPPTYQWDFNDCSGTNVAATLGGQAGTISGTGSTWVNNSGNCSLDFEFTSGTARVQFGTILDSFTSGTLLWWQNVESTGSVGTRRIFNKVGTSSADWAVFTLTTSLFRIGLRNAADSTNEVWETGNGALTLATWQCRALTINAPDLDCPQCGQFYNEAGTLISTTNTSNQTGARFAGTGGAFYFGGSGAANETVDGILDGLKIWVGARLRPDQIAAKCAEGRP